MKTPITGLGRYAVLGVLTALCMVGTMFIRIPIPATTGYFNLGDVFVILAGLWLGPWGGLVVGALGSSLADAIGFPQFILATAVTKGCEGFVAGLLGLRGGSTMKYVGAFFGGVVMVAGYFIFEAWIYPRLALSIPLFAVTDYNAALVELVPNGIQAIIGMAGGIGLWRLVRDASDKESPT